MFTCELEASMFIICCSSQTTLRELRACPHNISHHICNLSTAMDRRGYESPMDFEWHSQGPIDPTSPFYQLTQKQGQRRTYSQHANITDEIVLTPCVGGFDSPVRPENMQQSNRSSFTTSHSTNPPPPFRNPSFVTPRKPFDPELFSEASGADSSPAENADAEDTPDLPKSSKSMAAFTSGRTEKKPIFGKYGLNFTGNSPGRGELRRGRYGEAVVQKVRKRKRLERDYALVNHHRRGSWESDTESDAGRYRERRHGSNHSEPPQQPPVPKGWLSEFLSGIESRPTLPYVLSYYAQLILNWFVVFFVIYLVWNFFLTIRADVDKASETAAAEVLAEMAFCASQYTENRCGKDMRVPAMEPMCQNWETCMNKDPTKVGRARISAHTFAEIFNSFVEPISWKAMVRLSLIRTSII